MRQKEPIVPTVLLSKKSLRDFHSLAVLNADKYTVLRILHAYTLQVEVNGLAILSLDAGDTGTDISNINFSCLSFRLAPCCIMLCVVVEYAFCAGSQGYRLCVFLEFSFLFYHTVSRSLVYLRYYTPPYRMTLGHVLELQSRTGDDAFAICLNVRVQSGSIGDNYLILEKDFYFINIYSTT